MNICKDSYTIRIILLFYPQSVSINSSLIKMFTFIDLPTVKFPLFHIKAANFGHKDKQLYYLCARINQI